MLGLLAQSDRVPEQLILVARLHIDLGRASTDRCPFS